MIRRREDREFQAAAQGGLPNEEHRDVRTGVHIGVGEHAEGFEVGVGEQVRFINHDHGQPGAFGEFPGEQGRGLGREHSGEERGGAAERGDDLGVESAAMTVFSFRTGRRPARRASQRCSGVRPVVEWTAWW